MARPIDAIRRICDRTILVASDVERKAGSATTAWKIKAPAVIAVAAKCMARMTTKGPSIAAPSQSIGSPAALLADPKRETAVSRMRVHREHAPIDPVRAGASRTQRYRHLVAANASFTGIDALTGGIRHSNTAECRLQLLREPQCHLARCRRDSIADTRFGMIQKCVRGRFTRRKQEQQRDYYDDRAMHDQFLGNGLAGCTALPKIGLPIPRGSMSSR